MAIEQLVPIDAYNYLKMTKYSIIHPFINDPDLCVYRLNEDEYDRFISLSSRTYQHLYRDHVLQWLHEQGYPTEFWTWTRYDDSFINVVCYFMFTYLTPEQMMEMKLSCL